MKSRLLSFAIYLASTASGLLALLYPFFLPVLREGAAPGQMRSGEMPVMMTLLLGLCLLVLLYEVQGQAVNTRFIALMGVLVAINSSLRFIETAIPGPGGFTPIFFLIILSGYTFGGRFGFLMGALTMLVSGLVTGGIGPWLPSQMFTAGWVGMSAPLARPVVQALSRFFGGARDSAKQNLALLPTRPNPRVELIVLAGVGVLWGFLYGAVMNLWEWPFIFGPVDQRWSPGVGLIGTLQRYAAFYLVTSLVWDAIGAAGNLLLILAFGGPTLRALRRFQQRFTFTYTISESSNAVPPHEETPTRLPALNSQQLSVNTPPLTERPDNTSLQETLGYPRAGRTDPCIPGPG